MQPNPTLDQLQVFLAVADTGSFSAAARHLNRSQSVISYTIANLEAQLELQLFTRGGTREPRLTEAGVAMLEDARRMASALQGLRARAEGLKAGLEAEIAIVVDVSVPSPVLISVLKAFQEQFPTVSLRLHVGALGMVWDLVQKRQADIGIGGPPVQTSDDLTTIRVGEMTMTPAAAPDHPLALYKGPVPLSFIRDHVQLVVTDLSEQTKGRNFGVFAYRTWRLTDVGIKHDLMVAGLGWGGLPKWMIKDDVAEGRLVELDLKPYPESHYSLFALHMADNPLGPAAKWWVERFAREMAACAY
ncbi:LysR family transcriptional regulator [Phyllobacterium myrsinacearum]|jgi:DNA-binding transcriptional LysR family regulator|uniref:LysR family transcriptional regulator n=2 Tax=Pseudomonadota TaxID=1224 RepID=A0A2S9JCD4_9HYPH|nr:LysR family transcriptional regulator [Phyllobacterium myrsinacearum]PRD50462.1 LysR family transcriptional regulator [Phyllobacterium myrsinacearum]PWV95007.1 DNA-binding transcriptional LysR family regulator [Phyllobacterium myrsinacearum]RZV06882.1 DNA-binding transcriptional LysR family regulator [Phyllobacterium myrsinacearum]